MNDVEGLHNGSQTEATRTVRDTRAKLDEIEARISTLERKEQIDRSEDQMQRRFDEVMAVLQSAILP